MVDLKTQLYKIKEAEYEMERCTNPVRRRQLQKHINRMHKERSECMKYLRKGQTA